MPNVIEEAVIIDAPASAVWDALTRPDLMKQWMGEPEMNVEVHTDWTVGGSIVISGFHHVKFENVGTVLRFEPERALAYSHLSSLSRLPDDDESASLFDFRLAPVGTSTSLTLTVSNFPTETVYKHLALYWRVTLKMFREFVERGSL